MRRNIAALFLLLVVFYLGLGGEDRCSDGPPEGAPVCQMLCEDGCATAPIPTAPMPPPADPLPSARFEADRDVPLVSLPTEPEKDPPRA